AVATPAVIKGSRRFNLVNLYSHDRGVQLHGGSDSLSLGVLEEQHGELPPPAQTRTFRFTWWIPVLRLPNYDPFLESRMIVSMMTTTFTTFGQLYEQAQFFNKIRILRALHALSTTKPSYYFFSDFNVLGPTLIQETTFFENVKLNDEFVVITDDLSVPVLLGCPTLIKLKATIKLSSAGMHVITNDCHDNIIYSNKKMVRFDEPPTVVSDDFDRDYIYTDYKVNHVYQLLLGRANSTSMLSNDILYNVIYPNATIYPGDDSPGGQGDCNHSEKDPTTNYYVHYSV
ncbi:hypothetical protein FOL47_003591, partial [Perkinsus chesapeaki]